MPFFPPPSALSFTQRHSSVQSFNQYNKNANSNFFLFLHTHPQKKEKNEGGGREIHFRKILFFHLLYYTNINPNGVSLDAFIQTEVTKYKLKNPTLTLQKPPQCTPHKNMIL